MKIEYGIPQYYVRLSFQSVFTFYLLACSDLLQIRRCNGNFFHAGKFVLSLPPAQSIYVCLSVCLSSVISIPGPMSFCLFPLFPHKFISRVNRAYSFGYSKKKTCWRLEYLYEYKPTIQLRYSSRRSRRLISWAYIYTHCYTIVKLRCIFQRGKKTLTRNEIVMHACVDEEQFQSSMLTEWAFSF